MKRIILAAAAAALALPVFAQEDFLVGELNLGLGQRGQNTISSKFLEYRDIPQGVRSPLVLFKGKNGDFRYAIEGRNISQKDQRYRLRLRNESVRFEADYLSIPHNFGNGGNSLLRPVGDNAYRLSDDVQKLFQDWLLANPRQINYTTLAAMVAPSLDAAPRNIDLTLMRGRTNLGLGYAPKDANYDFGVTYFHERRSGTRAANGTSFGFGNVVETPEPVRYISQDVGVNGSFRGDWGSARASVHFNDFKDAFSTFGWDNPFRITDSTSASAYTGPSSSNQDGPKAGLAALPPDNQAVTAGGGVSFKIGSRSRLIADASFGQWRQNETPFIPYTTNTAIVMPDGRRAFQASLPGNKLDGKIDTASFSGYFTSRLTDDLRFNARYRRFELDNKTPRVRFDEGYTRFDAVWEDIPRISVPYGYTSDGFEAVLAYDFGKATLEGGYKYNKMGRTFRETNNTSENGLRLALDVRPSGWVMLRGLYEFAKRDYDHYETPASEEASYLCESPGGLVPCGSPGAVEEAPANQLTLRRPDQSKRDQQRYGGTLQISPPSGKATLLLQYTKTKYDLDKAPVPFEIASGSETPLGLQNSDYQTFTLEGDFSPTERATFYAYYSRENIDEFQTGRQSGATISLNPADAWASTVADRVDSVGGGANFVLRPDKWYLDLTGRYQKVDGNNSFSAGANRGTPENIPLFDDTKLTFVSAQLRYRVAKTWSVSAGAGYEDYKIRDAQTDGLLNYMPGSFFMQINNGNYHAWVGWAGLTYNW